MAEENKAPESGAPEVKSTTPEKNTLVAILAYIGPLVIVSYITGKDDPFVKFHIKQGLVLLVIEVAMWFAGSLLWFIWPVIGVINFALFVFAVLGVINAAQGKEKELPILGKFSKYFNF